MKVVRQLYPVADRPFDELREGGDARIDVGHLGPRRFRAREGEQAPGQVGGAVGAVERVVDVALRLVGRLRQPALREFEPADDDREHIVEVVRSEEHTSELQSLMRISYAVFCLKKKNK